MWLWHTIQKFLVFIRWLLDQLIDNVFHLLYLGHKHAPLPPVTDEILLTSATQLSAKIRQRELTSVQIVQAYIDRIKKVNGALNAVVDDR